MARRKKCQVFVSSTFEDLRDTRERVAWEVLKAGHIPVGMENFSATDDRGWKVIKHAIDESDFYVVLVAGRYGFVDDETKPSWTEREYDYAKSIGLPVFAFLRAWSAIPGDKIDPDRKRVDAFRARLREAHLCEEWTEEDDGAKRASIALLKAIAEDEQDGIVRKGWIRGPIDDVAAAELARLSEENRTLRAATATKAEPMVKKIKPHDRVVVAVLNQGAQTFGGSGNFESYDEAGGAFSVVVSTSGSQGRLMRMTFGLDTVTSTFFDNTQNAWRITMRAG